jgi:uncharacterized membrane protein (DUF2068 family)
MRLPRLFRNEEQIEKQLHVSIYILVYKFLLGLFEFAAGVSIGLFGSEIYRVIQRSLIQELSEDPHDLLARTTESILPNVLNHNTYVVLSLLILGLAKMAGAIGLVYKRNWGADLLVGLTVLMAPFQIANLIMHPRVFDFLYLVVGLLIALYLIEFKPRAWISRILAFR